MKKLLLTIMVFTGCSDSETIQKLLDENTRLRNRNLEMSLENAQVKDVRFKDCQVHRYEITSNLMKIESLHDQTNPLTIRDSIFFQGNDEMDESVRKVIEEKLAQCPHKVTVNFLGHGIDLSVPK